MKKSNKQSKKSRADRYNSYNNIVEVYDKELDNYDDIEDWMSPEFVERLTSYWALRERVIDKMVQEALFNDED